MENNLSVPIYSRLQMDSGFGVQFTCCCESSQASVAKIRNSISPSTAGINHTSVTEREREAEGETERKSEGDWAMRAVQLLLMSSPKGQILDTDTALYETVAPQELPHYKEGLYHNFNWNIS